MDDIVWLQSKATYATLSASLALAGGHRVALVFPAGESTCLHDAALLSAFHRRCELLGKEAVIIGGDAWLRAHAVAAGFQSATTLEDWGETAPELYTPRPRRAMRETPRLWLVIPRLANGDISDSSQRDARHEAMVNPEDWLSEPPDYVIALREAYGGRSMAVRAPVVTRDSTSINTPRDDSVSASERSERFEEMVVGRILETSGIHRTQMPGIL